MIHRVLHNSYAMCRHNVNKLIPFRFRFTVATAYSWNSDYYYDDTPYYFDGDDHIDVNQFKFPTYEPSQCNCIKLKDCTSFALKIQLGPKPLSNNLMKDIRKKACGYAGIEPLVCCPSADILPRTFRETTSEKPWIWDVAVDQTKPAKVKPTNVFNRLNDDAHYQRPNDVHVPQKPSKNFHTYKPKKYHYFEFEDPRTFRNCPPSFSPDFHLPPNFRHIKPFRNFHHIPAGYDSNRLDGEHNFIFPHVPTLTIDPPAFSSHAPKYPPNKLNLINSENCGISINSRIIGGDDAIPGQFPW